MVLHRYLGLTLAAFLLVAGSTGCVIAFYSELDALLNPALHLARPPVAGAPALEPVALHARVQAQHPSQRVDIVMLRIEPERSVVYFIDGRQVFVNPYNGDVMGSRKFGDLREGRKNLLTFVYELHYSLGLGKVGSYLFGGAALLWIFDCFVGAYLTFPPPTPRRAPVQRRRWLRRWASAWLLKTSQLFALVFTWHRASGLWIWGMLLAFAWSGVALNLNDSVYRPVMDAVLPANPANAKPARLPRPRTAPKLDIQAALQRGRQLMADAAERRAFRPIQERWLRYEPDSGSYNYTIESSRDLDERLPRTRVRFDGDDGRLLSFQAATGEGTREAFDTWLIALHFGTIRQLGIAYRAVVSCLGVMVALLSVTGVWIWWRKRSKRSKRRGNTQSASATSPAPTPDAAPTPTP
ncbi:MAG: PepSY-associated TM helix domain-containing protein [Polyangiaceae bacterium]